ncbi:hypothetical protein HQ590_07685 [bacterium]|nr:hypothetical protein [bacterium]
MTIELIREFLGWCLLINLAFLLYWFLMFTLAHDWIHRMHSKWFRLSVEQFDAIHYQGIAFYKIAVVVFNLVPYLALLMVG